MNITMKVFISLLSVLSITGGIMYYTSSSKAEPCKNRNEIPQGKGVCVSSSSVLETEFEILTDTIRIKPITSGLKTISGKFLHEISSKEMLVKFTMRNKGDYPIMYSKLQTPLSDRRMSHNFLSSHQENFRYIGVIAEIIGEMNEYSTIQPNEAISRIFDLAPYVQVSKTKGKTRLWLDFEMRIFEKEYGVPFGKVDMVVASKNEIEIISEEKINLGDIEMIPPPSNGGERRRLSSAYAYDGMRFFICSSPFPSFIQLLSH